VLILNDIDARTTRDNAEYSADNPGAKGKNECLGAQH
jgi:hypothetical protein